MNAAQIHLLVNHMPLASLTFGFFILIWGKIKNNPSILEVAFILLMIGGLFAVASYFTGDDAYDVVKNLPNFSKDRAHEHELAAKFGLLWTILTAVLATSALYFLKKKAGVPKALLYVVLILNLFTLTVLARTNHLGGQISHPEIRSK